MSETLWRRYMVFSGVTLTTGICLMPFLYMGLVSLVESPEFLGSKAAARWTWSNYFAVLATPSLHFLDYLRNSLLISAFSAVAAVGISSLAAFAITRLPLPGKGWILMGVLAVSMFPQISLVSYLFKLMTSLGWINTYAALVLPYTAWVLPLSLWILVSYFSQIPPELDKAAVVDGCSPWQLLWRVLLPLAAPGVFSTALLAFIFAFNEFLFALLLTSDHHSRTIPVGIALFQGLHGEMPWGNIMAASFFTTIPVIVLTLAFQKNIIQGLTQGAVKG